MFGLELLEQSQFLLFILALVIRFSVAGYAQAWDFPPCHPIPTPKHSAFPHPRTPVCGLGQQDPHDSSLQPVLTYSAPH